MAQTKLNRGVKRISKTYACEKILHYSPSTFDTYVKLGIIPPGHKEVGFKELSWSKKDFDEATLNKVRKYRSKMEMLVLVKYGIISKKFKEVFILKVKR